MESLLTPEKLAQVLGLSVQTVYNRYSLGLSMPPAIKVGRLLRFRSHDVDAWLTSCYAPTAQPVESTPLPPRRGRPCKADQIKRRKGRA